MNLTRSPACSRPRLVASGTSSRPLAPAGSSGVFPEGGCHCFRRAGVTARDSSLYHLTRDAPARTPPALHTYSRADSCCCLTLIHNHTLGHRYISSCSAADTCRLGVPGRGIRADAVRGTDAGHLVQIRIQRRFLRCSAQNTYQAVNTYSATASALRLNTYVCISPWVHFVLWRDGDDGGGDGGEVGGGHGGGGVAR